MRFSVWHYICSEVIHFQEDEFLKPSQGMWVSVAVQLSGGGVKEFKDTLSRVFFGMIKEGIEGF